MSLGEQSPRDGAPGNLLAPVSGDLAGQAALAGLTIPPRFHVLPGETLLEVGAGTGLGAPPQ